MKVEEIEKDYNELRKEINFEGYITCNAESLAIKEGFLSKDKNYWIIKTAALLCNKGVKGAKEIMELKKYGSHEIAVITNIIKDARIEKPKTKIEKIVMEAIHKKPETSRGYNFK